MLAGLGVLVGRKDRSNYAFETVLQPGLDGRRSFQPRGRGFGGSSRINAMICIRGQAENYDLWRDLGCAGWGWADVLPLSKRLEDDARGAGPWHGVGGPLLVSDLAQRSPMSEAFVAAAASLQFRRDDDFNGAEQEGVGFYQVFQRYGRRINAGQAYLRTMADRANLTVLTNQPAQRILLDGNCATGVVVGRGRSERCLHARREVVLSAGAFGSPQLLILSGIGPGAHLESHDIEVVQAVVRA